MLKIIGLLILLACTGALYQFISTKFDKQKYPSPGNLVDVGGYRLHMHCMGTGEPTVVLDAGLSGISSDWWQVAPEIAKFSRVVTYDRAGTGWSDKGPQPRTSAQIVQELHTLLHAAKIPGPYILVGHSSAANVSEAQKAYLQQFHSIWNELQIELVAKFPGGRQMIATKSDHMIPWHQPDIIVQAVQELISAKNSKNTLSSENF